MSTYGYYTTFSGSGRIDRPVETGFPTRREAQAAADAAWGDRNPSYNPYIVMDDDEAEADQDVHSGFHTPNRPDWACKHCDAAGWNK